VIHNRTVNGWPSGRDRANNSGVRNVAVRFALFVAVGAALPAYVAAQTTGITPVASFSGRVVDTAGKPLEGVEVALTDLRRRALSNSAGAFRIDSVPRGQWVVRVRKIGYAAETRTVDVDSTNAPVEFRLVETVRKLVPIVTSASRLGLAGIVNDPAGKPVEKARVRVLGTGLETMTDSAGAFWIPAPAGNFMVAVGKKAFAERLAGVSIPRDSGRQVTIWLKPATAIPVREAWKIEDFRERLAWTQRPSQRLNQSFLTRDALEKEGYEWIYDVVQDFWLRQGRQGFVSQECALVVDGGPGIVSLGGLLVDDIESIEIYSQWPKAMATVAAAAPRKSSLPGGQFVEADNTRYAKMKNGGVGRCLAVYVWLR
jgi:hypothetical protein